MAATFEGGYEHKRQILSEIVPLQAPFTLFISPTHRCNFKCYYCTHSKNAEEKEHSGFQVVDISEDLIDRLLSQVQFFEGKIKRIVFTGLGEPLMNKHLPDIIRRFSDIHAAEGYELITNAYLLTPEMTDRLLDAGLTYLRVSIQGINEDQYYRTTGIHIDYEKLVSQLRYFYEHKGNCKLYIKTMDASLDDETDQEIFIKQFSEMCDKIYVEHLVRAQPSMIKKYGSHVSSEKTFYGDISEYRAVCPYLFYILQVDSVGNVFPCPPLGFTEAFSLGNVMQTTLGEIWNGKRLYELQMQHLKGNRHDHPICGGCENYLCFTPKEDNLDNATDEIRKRLQERGCN